MTTPTAGIATGKQQPQTTYLVHGEPDAANTLCQKIESELHWRVQVAQWMQKVPFGEA